jgi:hypothetical protein
MYTLYNGVGKQIISTASFEADFIFLYNRTHILSRKAAAMSSE